MKSEPGPHLTDLFSINPRSETPIYKQIINQVKLLIAAGKLEHGDELPSIRALSVPLGVNPMTISKAYGILEGEDIVIRRPGRPLIIGEIGGRRLDRERHERLRQSLAEAVDVVKRLDFDSREAVAVFEDLLDETKKSPTDGEASR